MMDVPPPDPVMHLRAALTRLLPAMQERAASHDRDARFPAESITGLRAIGALQAVLPTTLGGSGLGTEPHATRPAFAVMHLLGQADLAVARVFEAHVNALRLVMRYGNSVQQQDAARAVHDGALFALWVTDASEAPLRLRRHSGLLTLAGGKRFCSAAGYASHAVVTAQDEADAPRLLLVPLDGSERVEPLPAPLAGLRAAATGAVDFTGMALPEAAVFGTPGDYLREPDFSAGAWRASAAALGALTTLIEATRSALTERGHANAALQQARFGRCLIAHATAAAWLLEAACMAENPGTPAARCVATVNLARIGAEAACLEAIQHVQRSLGLSAFLHGSLVERVCRDLATYLRQPAPDAVLCEAAAYFLTHPLPDPL